MLPRYLSAVEDGLAHARRAGSTLRGRAATPLFVSSLYLMAGPLVSAGLGFAFWMIAARTSDSAAIGIAAAAIAAVNLLMALSELGIGTAVIHYAPSAGARRTALINAVIRPGWIAISLAAAVFLAGLSLWSPGLLPLSDSAFLIILFVTYAAFNQVLGLQDASMIAQGNSRYVLLRSLACNVPSVLLVVPLVALMGGHIGLFAAYAVPNVVVGVVVGLAILPRQFPGYRFFGTWHRGTIRTIASYGLANHAGNILWAIPLYALPMIAINSLTAAEAGRFFIIWAVANLLLIAPRMITYAMFAESSRAVERLRALAAQSVVVVAAVTVPAGLALWFGGGILLGFFGAEYANEDLLRILLLSVIPFSINSVWFVVLRVRRRLREIVLFAGLTMISIVVFAAILVTARGVEGIALGWLLGHTAAAPVAVGRALQLFAGRRPARQ